MQAASHSKQPASTSFAATYSSDGPSNKVLIYNL